MAETEQRADENSEACDDILARYYAAWFRFHPEAAVDVGEMDYADRLAPYDDDDIGALLTLHEELMGSVDELDVAALDADRRTDTRLAYGAAFIEIEDFVKADWRHRDPGRFLPINAIYQLTLRNFDGFADALMGRLERIPDHLRGARQFVAETPAEIPRLWAQSAITEARRGVEFLRGLPKHPAVLHEPRRLRNLDAALKPVIDAVTAFADFLDQEILPQARGDFACGAERFADRLQYRHFLDVDADALHRFGSDLFAQTERELKDAAKRLHGSDDVAAYTRKLQQDHPAAEELLSAYREQMQAAREFVAANDLVTLPAAERLDVVETPVFLRHRIPFAAYMEPARNDPEQHGYYYVTPVTDEAMLGEHNHAALMHTCAHEAWPGHHHQFVTANLRPNAATLARVLNPSATLYEGWALYCEQMMREQGFLDRPEQEFILLKDRLWRALRVMIDVEIHTRGLSLDAAAQRMVAALGFTPEQAHGDLTWYTRAPTVPMGYATGWALINAARDRLRLAEQDQFDLKHFHDRLLSAGSIALPLAMRDAFGDGIWRNANGMVFGATSAQAT